MKKASGFTLVEVLVTLVLTAVGILGMVAMQSRAIHQTQDAIQRNNAVMLVNELVDIMRVNASDIFEHIPPHVPLYIKHKDESIFYKTPGSDFSTTGTCTNPSTAKTAQEQLNCWVARVNHSLPLGPETLKNHSYVCLSSAPGVCGTGSTIEIQLAWSAKKGTCLIEKKSEEGTEESEPDETCFYRTRVEL